MVSLFWLAVSGGGWWWVYFGWWWVFFGWWWMVVGGGTVYNSPVKFVQKWNLTHPTLRHGGKW